MHAMIAKTFWNLTCVDGTWMGLERSPPTCGHDGADEDIYYGNKSCSWRKSEPNVVTFFHDTELAEEDMDFKPGTMLVS